MMLLAEWTTSFAIMLPRTLAACLQSNDDATPSIHNAFSERDDVVVHLVRTLGRSSDSRGLLQNLRDDRQVRLEVATDGASDIAEALQDSRLELVSQGSALQSS